MDTTHQFLWPSSSSFSSSSWPLARLCRLPPRPQSSQACCCPVCCWRVQIHLSEQKKTVSSEKPNEEILPSHKNNDQMHQQAMGLKSLRASFRDDFLNVRRTAAECFISPKVESPLTFPFSSSSNFRFFDFFFFFFSFLASLAWSSPTCKAYSLCENTSHQSHAGTTVTRENSGEAQTSSRASFMTSAFFLGVSPVS